MIIYTTKKTVERYKLKLPAELPPPINKDVQALMEKESGDKLLEWGAKLFYFDGKKCIQIVNFASKLTLILMDIKIADLENIGDMIAYYLFELYKKDKEMTKALEKMFEGTPMFCFAKLTDKGVIGTLNTTQSQLVYNGYCFFESIQDAVLYNVEINHAVNFEWVFNIKINGKTKYVRAGENFKKILLDRYGKGQ